LCGPGLASHVGATQSSDPIAARAAEGAAAMQAGRFDAAATIYAELTAARPDDPGLLMNLGMARYMAGHPDQALAPLQKAARLNPSLAPASLFLGASLLDLGRSAEAASPLQRAVAAMPENADAREMLARAYLDTSEFTKASDNYRTLATIRPKNPKGWYGLTRAYEGIAEQALDALQQQAPDSPLLELIVADVAVSQEKYPAALAIYRRVMEGTPPVGGLHEAVVEIYERAGKPDWAAQERRAIKPRPAASCAAHVAECDFLAGKFREALAAAAQSSNPAGRYWTIRAANRLATESVARLESLPPSIELHLIRADLAQSSGRKTEAVTEIRAALAMSPGNPALETALADALLQAHATDEAVPLLERLMRERPDTALLFMYGDALLQSQQIERAIPILERTVAAKDAPVAAHAALGRAYVQVGRYADALSHLTVAVKEDQDGDTHLQLARTFQALGRTADAQRAMSEYQRLHQRAAPTANAEQALTPPKE
jgi:predicted Zn-dependent protease